MKSRLLCLLAISILLASACGSTEGGAANQLSDRCLIQATTQAIFEYGARGTSGWILVRRSWDIPFNNKGKDPQDYRDVIQQPKVTHENDQSTVTFYTWTKNNGVLGYWEGQVEGETLKFFHGEVVDYYIGAYKYIQNNTRPGLPLSKGVFIANDKVNILLSEICH